MNTKSSSFSYSISDSILVEHLSDFVGLVYPVCCAGCKNVLNKGEQYVCTKCLYSLPETDFYQYDDNPVAKLFWGRVDVKHAISGFHFHKGGVLQALLHHLKYKGVKEIGYYLGMQLGKLLLKTTYYKEFDFIVPVPLHEKRFKMRGYNQSEWIGKGISSILSIPVDTTTVVRSIETKTQTKKNREDRWKNVADVFEITEDEALFGKHILLVDDVVTTGATLDACAQEIHNVENVKISIATLAYA